MLFPITSLVPIEILLQAIYARYLSSSYCLTFVTELPILLSVNISCVYLNLNGTTSLTDQLLQVSDIGCSDYIVRTQDSSNFMIAFEEMNRRGTVRRSDRKIIFAPYNENDETRTKLLDVLNLTETGFVANVLLLLPVTDSGNCSTYDLVTHRFVGSNAESHLPLYLHRWNSCTKFEHNANLFPHDISNLHGRTLKVACFTYKPYVLLDIDTSIEVLGRDGTEVRIMDEFCRWINCSIEVVRDDEHEWGEIYDNRTGVGVLGNVAEDRADLGITAVYSWYEVYVFLDFSAAGIRTSITCVAPSPRLLASWEMPLEPFSWVMWILLLFTLIYASLALSIARGCSMDRVFLTTFGMMITQSQFEAGSTWRIRSVTGWLLLTGLVLDNAYGGGLASVFTVPKYEKSIDTVHDIVDRKMDWGATHDAWIFSLTLSEEPLVKQLLNQFRVLPAEVLKKKSFERNIALSIEKLPAGYFAIGDYITKEALLDLSVMREDFYYEHCVVMLRKSSPFTDKVTQFIGRLHETGLMLAWETQVALKYLNYEVQLEVRLSRSKKDVDGIEPLSFRHVVGIFIIYSLGISASFVLFTLELLYHRKKSFEN